jgi:carbonic anhydrase
MKPFYHLLASIIIVLALGNFSVYTQSSQAVQTKELQDNTSPLDALHILKEGWQRYTSGKMISRDLMAQVKATASSQYPHSVILSCLDSRVIPELVFDQGIGDIFDARIAGNFINDDILGSMEFACKVSGAKLIMVVGHTNCGAIKGAIDDAKLGHLTQLLAKIKPAIDNTPYAGERTSKDLAYVDLVSKENVLLAIEDIKKRSPVLKEMLDKGEIMIAGCMYDLETGNVVFY